MPEANGYRNERLDRIEHALELLIADHEQFRNDHKQLLTAQLLQKDAIDQLLKVTQEQTQQIEKNRHDSESRSKELDARVDNLVSAIADLIRRIPPENLHQSSR